MAPAATRKQDLPPALAPWMNFIQAIGFPAAMAAYLLWMQLAQQPQVMREYREAASRDTDRIVARLDKFEDAESKKADAIYRQAEAIQAQTRQMGELVTRIDAMIRNWNGGK